MTSPLLDNYHLGLDPSQVCIGLISCLHANLPETEVNQLLACVQFRQITLHRTLPGRTGSLFYTRSCELTEHDLPRKPVCRYGRAMGLCITFCGGPHFVLRSPVAVVENP